MKPLTVIALILLALLTGCATNDYTLYSQAQTSIATAKASSETARYNALAQIAKDGDSSAKVAAVMALAIGNGSHQAVTQIAAPQRSDALMWASILIPGVTQAWAISRNADVAINASNNAMLTSTATTAGFVGIAGKIQAPAANISTTTADSHDTSNTSTTSMSGTGVLGSGSYNTQANPVTTPTPIVVPDVVQITPIVVPDVVQITPTAAPPL